MKEAVEAQQQQIHQLIDQAQTREQKLQELEQRLDRNQAVAIQAQTKADTVAAQTAEEGQTVTALKSDVTDLQSNATNAALSLQETQKNLQSSIESPLALHFKGITITPGGFLAAESVRRTRALASDVNTPFNSVPLPGSSQAALSEFFGSGRQSRVSMLAEGTTTIAKLSGYMEADFLSAGVTSNNNQSNSYTMRQRQVWGQAALNDGLTFTGGQMWSLVTETKHGVDNRTEALPMTIDAQYHVGFSWARQYGLRLSKNYGNKFWLAASIENAQATLTTHNNAPNFLVGAAGTGGGLYNSTANYSFNQAPDFIVKAVFEPGFGHYEIFGVVSRFRDRVFPCGDVVVGGSCGGVTGVSAWGAYNSSKTGAGFGANARWSVLNKHLDLGLHALAGNGVGRYGTSGLPDSTVRADGTLYLLKSYQGLGTIEWHESPKLDIYLNAGAEYAGRTWEVDPITGNPVGYGSPLFLNSGCFSEKVPGSGGGFIPGSLSSCTGDTRVVIEGTGGFWYRLYNGPKGRVQWGPQFSYVTRNTWTGFGGEPHGVDGMIFTSFRYYLP